MKKEIKLYTWPRCPYSNGAKQLLNERGLEYTDVNIYQNDEMRHQLEEKTNHYTVPFIFIGDTCIGGLAELRDLDNCGKIRELMK